MDAFADLCERCHFSEPRIPVHSSLAGCLIRDASTIQASYLERQAREPVDFPGALKAIEESFGIEDGNGSGGLMASSFWIEIGPRRVIQAEL